jgi:membrane-bound lytic murein transglycosylase B
MKYIVEIMSKADYTDMMTGGHGYKVNRTEIEADSAQHAYELAVKANPNMMVNKYIRTVDEIEAERKATEIAWQAQLDKEAQAKAKRKANEERKAEALGMTVAEYRAKVAHDRKVKRAEAKVAELEAELAKARAVLEALRKA